MPCGACAKAKARRQASLERRRAAARQKEIDRLARAVKAQQKQTLELQQKADPIEVKPVNTPSE